MASGNPLSPIPHPPKKPIVGNMFSVDAKAPIQSLTRMTKELGPIFWLDLMGAPVVFVSGFDLVDELSDQKRFDKAVRGSLRRVRAIGEGQVAAQFATQQNDPPLTTPSNQPKCGFLALPALAGIRPIRLLHRSFERSFHICRHAQAEQIGQIVLLRPRHDPLDAPRLVAPQQGRPARRTKMVQ